MSTGLFQNITLTKLKWNYFDLAKTQIRTNDIKRYNIEVFLGTWCKDSQRKVPHFLKTLNGLNYPKEKLKMFSVVKINGKLDNREYNKRIKNIQKVPTCFFYKDPSRRWDVSWNHPTLLDSKVISY